MKGILEKLSFCHNFCDQLILAGHSLTTNHIPMKAKQSKFENFNKLTQYF